MTRDFDPNFVTKKCYFIVGVKTLVFNDKGKFLLLRRSSKTDRGGRWSLPGGALEYDEDAYDAAQREIEEETLLQVKDLKSLGVKTYTFDDEHVVILGFRCLFESGEVDLNWEHDEFKWVSKEEALKYELTPDAKYFIELS